MGTNEEIRQRLETYRNVLLAFVWVAAIAGIIGALYMIGYETGGGGWRGPPTNPLRPYGIALLIASIIGGIIGHFLVNVGLAIPFILLNNGDYLAAIYKGGADEGTASSDNPSEQKIPTPDGEHRKE